MSFQIQKRSRTLSVATTDSERKTRSKIQPVAPSPVQTVGGASSPEGLRMFSKHGRVLQATTFRSEVMKITVYSPSVRRSLDSGVLLPVFGDQDRIVGSVMLDPDILGDISARLIITFKGMVEYTSPTLSEIGQLQPGRISHSFYEQSTVVPLQPTSFYSLSGFRKPFAAAFRVGRTSGSPPPASRRPKVYNFDFELPSPSDSTEEWPPTFSASNTVGDLRSRTIVERVLTQYRVCALWEAQDGSRFTASLEMPILIQPETDFQSLDCFQIEPESWYETPLHAVDWPELPAHCAVTIPNPAIFPRSSVIPYFVVFTTRPRCHALAAKFMTDSTISVSLVRRITFLKSNGRSSSMQTDVRAAWMGSKAPASASVVESAFRPPVRHDRLLRTVRSSPILSSNSPAPAQLRYGTGILTLPREVLDKPLPPPPTISEVVPNTHESESHLLAHSRTLHIDFSNGFPKRPQGWTKKPNSHPSLESLTALPDALYKSSIPLRREWLPSMHSRGLMVEYFINVLVTFDSREFRVQVPIRVC